MLHIRCCLPRTQAPAVAYPPSLVHLVTCCPSLIRGRGLAGLCLPPTASALPTPPHHEHSQIQYIQPHGPSSRLQHDTRRSVLPRLQYRAVRPAAVLVGGDAGLHVEVDHAPFQHSHDRPATAKGTRDTFSTSTFKHSVHSLRLSGEAWLLTWRRDGRGAAR